MNIFIQSVRVDHFLPALKGRHICSEGCSPLRNEYITPADKNSIMAINKNHEFEDLDGVKCAVVEKNTPQHRVDFLKKLLEYNHYTVVVVASPPPKAAAAAPAAEGIAAALPPPPASFTVGVTDVMFNATNAVFGRLLHTPDGNVVTLAYWQQKETVSQDEIPYYERH